MTNSTSPSLMTNFISILSETDKVDGSVLESYAKDAFDAEHSGFSQEEFLSATEKLQKENQLPQNEGIVELSSSAAAFQFPSTLPSPSYTPNLDIARSPNAALPHIFNLPFGNCFGVKPLASPPMSMQFAHDPAPVQSDNSVDLNEARASMILPPLSAYGDYIPVPGDLTQQQMYLPDGTEISSVATGGKIRSRRNRGSTAGNGVDREFVCTFANCGKKFKRSEHLKRHIRSHTGARPYQCDICQKAFSRSDNLSQHKKTHAKSLSKENILQYDAPYYG